MNLGMETELVRTRNLNTTQVDRELMMVDFDRGRYFGMNEVAADIWRLLADPVTLGDICASLQADYDVDRDSCYRGVIDFVHSLREAGLVELSSAT